MYRTSWRRPSTDSKRTRSKRVRKMCNLCRNTVSTGVMYKIFLNITWPSGGLGPNLRPSVLWCFSACRGVPSHLLAAIEKGLRCWVVHSARGAVPLSACLPCTRGFSSRYIQLTHLPHVTPYRFRWQPTSVTLWVFSLTRSYALASGRVPF